MWSQGYRMLCQEHRQREIEMQSQRVTLGSQIRILMNPFHRVVQSKRFRWMTVSQCQFGASAGNGHAWSSQGGEWRLMRTENHRFVTVMILLGKAHDERPGDQDGGQDATIFSLRRSLLLWVLSEEFSSGEIYKLPCLVFLIWFGMSTCQGAPWFSLI